MAKAVAILGAGQIGFAGATAFREAGWDVRVLARSRPDWLFDGTVFEPYVTGESTAPSADIVLDTIAFDASDVNRYDPDRIGRLIVVSSASVYCDDEGRTLDEASQNGFPEFGGPIAEEQPTVAPGDETYSTRKVRMENRAQELFGGRATILRPCAIYGPHSRHPREWWFVKRMLDGRDRIALIHEGASRFQTTNVEDIGLFAVHATEHALGGAYNIADEDAPSVLEIGKAIARILGRDPEFDCPAEAGMVGRTPWSIPLPFITSTAKTKASGYEHVSRYGEDCKAAIEWLCNLNPTDWRAAFPQLAAYPWDLFDYEAEDRFFASL